MEYKMKEGKYNAQIQRNHELYSTVNSSVQNQSYGNINYAQQFQLCSNKNCKVT